MNGQQIREARERRQWTQQQLATAVGVGQRTVGNWERGESIPQNRMGKLREVLGIAAEDAVPNPLETASDLALLSELMRRAIERGQQ